MLSIEMCFCRFKRLLMEWERCEMGNSRDLSRNHKPCIRLGYNIAQIYYLIPPRVCYSRVQLYHRSTYKCNLYYSLCPRLPGNPETIGKPRAQTCPELLAMYSLKQTNACLTVRRRGLLECFTDCIDHGHHTWVLSSL